MQGLKAPDEKRGGCVSESCASEKRERAHKADLITAQTQRLQRMLYYQKTHQKTNLTHVGTKAV